MHVLSPVLGAMVLMTFSGPALALDAWKPSTERGLPVLELASDAGKLRLVCDPDRVFGPTPNGALVVRFDKDAAPEMVVVLAKSGEQARLPVKNGLAAQASVGPADWSKMVATFRAGGEFALVTSADSVTFETAPLPDLACE
jgi:hypothetical protein